MHGSKYGSLAQRLAEDPGQWYLVESATGREDALHNAGMRWRNVKRRHGLDVSCRRRGSVVEVYAQWPKGADTGVIPPSAGDWTGPMVPVDKVPPSRFSLDSDDAYDLLRSNPGRWAAVWEREFFDEKGMIAGYSTAGKAKTKWKGEGFKVAVRTDRTGGMVSVYACYEAT